MGHFFQYTAGTLFFDIVESRHFKMQSRHFKVAISISGPSRERQQFAMDVGSRGIRNAEAGHTTHAVREY